MGSICIPYKVAVTMPKGKNLFFINFRIVAIFIANIKGIYLVMFFGMFEDFFVLFFVILYTIITVK